MSKTTISRIDAARGDMRSAPLMYAKKMAAIARAATTDAQLGLVFAAIIEDGTLHHFTTIVDAYGCGSLIAKGE
jgi:hypothetical protein